MPRSDWSIIAALVGCLALAWAALDQSHDSKHERYQRYRYAADKQQDVDSTLAQTHAERLEYREPCHNPKGRDESDLCAQWRAAKAGEDSALWAKWSFWIGLAGLFGLLASLHYTRKAVQAATDATKDADRALAIAERSADAASSLATISADTAIKQLRAYLVISDINIVFVMESPSNRTIVGYQLQCVWKNTGQTPAINVLTEAHDSYIKHGIEFFEYQDFQDEIRDYTTKVSIGSGQEKTLLVNLNLAEMKQKGKGRCLIYGWIEYDDVVGSGQRHRTEFCNDFIFPKPDSPILKMFGPFNGMDGTCYRKPQT